MSQLDEGSEDLMKFQLSDAISSLHGKVLTKLAPSEKSSNACLNSYGSWARPTEFSEVDIWCFFLRKPRLPVFTEGSGISEVKENLVEKIPFW